MYIYIYIYIYIQTLAQNWTAFIKISCLATLGNDYIPYRESWSMTSAPNA